MTDSIPRLFLAALTEHADVRSMTLALAAALGRSGYQPQIYRTVSFVEASDCMRPLFGLATRHLDPWILSPQRCRELFARTATLVDIALIETCGGYHDPTTLWGLAIALECPVVGVAHAEELLDGGVCLKLPPPGILQGVLVDGLDRDDLAQFQELVPRRCCSPMLGGIDAACLKPDGTHPESSRHIRNLATLLSDSFLELSDIEQIVAIASSRPFPFGESPPELPQPLRRPRVAVAWDDAFRRYLPDALDELEAAGAEVIDFAPAACETLPQDVDAIWIGAGELTGDYLRRFADNVCIQSALRSHACRGKPIYAEGAGAALLCQEVRLEDGTIWPMTGIIPATLLQQEPAAELLRTEFRPSHACWVLDPECTYRGYRSRQWRFDEVDETHVVVRCERTSEPLIVRRKNCLASVVHLNFAACPEAVRRALRPLQDDATTVLD